MLLHYDLAWTHFHKNGHPIPWQYRWSTTKSSPTDTYPNPIRMETTLLWTPHLVLGHSHWCTTPDLSNNQRAGNYNPHQVPLGPLPCTLEAAERTPSPHQLDLPNYQQAARTLFEQKHLISPRAQEALFKLPLAQVLLLPPPKLQTWVVRGYKYFTQQLKAEKKQAALGTPDIRNFFQPLAQHPDDLHPPWDDPVTLNQCGSSLYIVDIER